MGIFIYISLGSCLWSGGRLGSGNLGNKLIVIINIKIVIKINIYLII